MRVTVLLFAALREALGKAQIDLDVPDSVRVKDVLELLRASHPTLTHRKFAVAVNRTYCDEEYRVSGGDQIALIPPVSGG